ncbi:mandelate racemase/muconate lactonizing enzyme family protein [Virgibacillus senegalensis]|uniref:mandelate racemase/muconate lactonizing enzyme family protein n=1 Tax=Virgibacillus senegalensis TaxID=1499679 RepID=UPI00069D096F|nr:mandelate racemase/muconate lactonizing enzyme family protein [Virgibacillus senegalensis]
MEITNVEVFPLKVDKGVVYLGESSGLHYSKNNYYLRPEYRSFYSKSLETLLVKISTSSGIEGWGECLAPVAPEVAGTVIESLFSSYLLGKDPKRIDVIWNKLYDSMRERGYFSGFMVDAITAIDIALWDILGKVHNVPVYQLLGGNYIDKIPAYVSGLPKQTIEEKKVLANDWREKQFQNIKLHLGYGLEEDVRIISQLKNNYSDINFMVDAHWHYSPKEAVILSEKLSEYDVKFIEAPVLAEDIDGNHFVRENSRIPIALGEAIRTRYQFKERLVKHATDILQPDIGRVGITEAKKIANMAEAFNVPIAPHLSVGLGVCIAATLHVSASINNFYMLEYQPTVFPVANDLLANNLVCEKGFYHLPEDSGLGIAIDEEKVRYYSIRKEGQF